MAGAEDVEPVGCVVAAVGEGESGGMRRATRINENEQVVISKCFVVVVLWKWAKVDSVEVTRYEKNVEKWKKVHRTGHCEQSGKNNNAF